jgi:hypothetical protein
MMEIHKFHRGNPTGMARMFIVHSIVRKPAGKVTGYLHPFLKKTIGPGKNRRYSAPHTRHESAEPNMGGVFHAIGEGRRLPMPEAPFV